MQAPDRIILVGPMGVGKTTVGRQLARALNRPFQDADRAIEERTGASIPWIFDIEGEEGFRSRERGILDELTREPELVLATGGGAVLDPDTRRKLAERGYVIYLYAPAGHLYERTRYDRNRPLLQTEDPRARLEALMAERDPLYRETAHRVVETGNRPARAVVREIIRPWREE
ncbi:shikimate kinase AroK [Thiohalospira halophila]|nr:shikimate kinase AroK [Thiohalospira halophila]